jgi:hypothetical protein
LWPRAQIPGGGGSTYLYCQTGAAPNVWLPVSSTNPCPVTATVSASVGGFQPSASGARGTPITVTTSDSSGTLPTGAVVIVTNVGTNPAYCNVNGVAATTADQYIAPDGGSFPFTIPSGVTVLHCIATGGSTSVNTLGGSGLATSTAGTASVTGTNPAAGATGSAVPADASYGGLNLAGNLVGQTAVNPSGSVYAAQGDLSSVAGTTVLAGTGAVGAGSPRVAVARDATTIAGAAPGTAGSASANVVSVQGIASGTNLPVSQATASALNATVVGAGSAGTANAGVVTIQGIASMTPVQVSQATASNLNAAVVGVGSAGSASGGVLTVQGVASMTPFLANPGTAANWGVGATGSAVPANAIYNGVNAVSSEPAKATTGNLTGVYADLSGKVVTSPFANRENGLSCAVTLTASTSATTCTGMGAQGANVKIYITDLTCTRSDAGTTSATMTLDDAATTIIDMPNNGGGGGFSHTYNVPLVVAANTAFTVQSGTSLSSVHCSASGFKGY